MNIEPVWKKYKPFMSEDAIRYMEQKDSINSRFYEERYREQLIKDILDRIDIKIENLASKPLSELEAILGRVFS